MFGNFLNDVLSMDETSWQNNIQLINNYHANLMLEDSGLRSSRV